MKKNGIPARLYIALAYLFLYIPILVLIIFSFNDSKSKSVWTGFTLDWYRKLVHNPSILNAFFTTVAVSLLAALLATVIGTASAVGFRNLKRRFRSVCLTVNNIPLTNADIITGVTMMLLFLIACNAWNGPVRTLLAPLFSRLSLVFPRLSPGFWSLLIAHITFDIPYVILSVLPKLRALNPNIFEAAQDLGAGSFYAFRRVILPEIMPGVVNGFLMAFTLSVDDFVISYFTAGVKTQTLSMLVYSMAKKRVSPEVNALSTLLFVIVVGLMLLVNLRQARQEKAMHRRISAPEGEKV